MLDRRAIDLTVLANLKSAWSSPSACVKSNWCRIPSAVIIALGLLVLFTFFCCCAQCLSCCCCRPKRKRGFADTESGSRALLPHSTSYGGSGGAGYDLPSMPSYKLDSLKAPQYAVIGDDGSVTTTEDPEKRLRDDFPSSSATMAGQSSPNRADYTGPDFNTPPATAQPDIFAAANGSFHDTLLHQHQDEDTSYAPSQASIPNYPPSYRSGVSPSRRNQYGEPGMDTLDNSTFPRQQTSSGQRGPRTQMAQTQNLQSSNTSRTAFNEGGPFPILGRKPVLNSSGKQFNSASAMDVTSRGTRLPSPPRSQYRNPPREQYPIQQHNMDDFDSPASPAPYPQESPVRHGLLSDNHEFDPYAARRGHF